jgi:hypothetical protein
VVAVELLEGAIEVVLLRPCGDRSLCVGHRARLPLIKRPATDVPEGVKPPS